MDTTEQGWAKYLPIVGVLALIVIGVLQLMRRERKPRSFREDPIGALKDRGDLLADKAQDATEEMLTRLQESLDELRGRLPDLDKRRKAQKRRNEVNQRLTDLNGQVQSLLKELRGSNFFSR